MDEDAVDAGVDETAAVDVVVDGSVVDAAALSAGGAEPPDWLCNAANRLCRKAVTASLDDEASVDAVLSDDVAVDALADDVDDVPSSEMPRLANAFLMAVAKRPPPPSVDVVPDVPSVFVAKGLEVEVTPLNSDVVRLEPLIEVMDMACLFGRSGGDARRRLASACASKASFRSGA